MFQPARRPPDCPVARPPAGTKVFVTFTKLRMAATTWFRIVRDIRFISMITSAWQYAPTHSALHFVGIDRRCCNFLPVRCD